MKRFFRSIHLYLSLAAGLVIMTACFTGAILVFEKELQEAFHHNRYFVQQSGTRLTVDEMMERVKDKYPAAKTGAVKVYTDPLRSVEIGVTIQRNDKVPAKDRVDTKAREQSSGGKQARPTSTARPSGGGEGRSTHTAFVNPYTGQILDLYSYRETFFFTMFSLHRWLLGTDSGIGKIIVGVSTFIFLFILITGIILWWPKTQKILLQRLKIKTNGSWKRLNHDLHIVLGFYTAIFLFIFAFTGLAWSFQWFNKGIYTVTRSEMKQPTPPQSNYQAGLKPITYTQALTIATGSIKGATYYNLRKPADSMAVYVVNVLSEGAHELASDNYYIDQYSGQVIGALKFSDKNLGQRVRSTFKPVHVGSIYGWPSKIIAFITCVLGTTFPVTGVIMWLNRLKKQKKRNQAGNVVVSNSIGLQDEDDDDVN